MVPRPRESSGFAATQWLLLLARRSVGGNSPRDDVENESQPAESRRAGRQQ